MLILEIPERELFNDDSLEFIKLKKESLQLEHSLVSLSKWESIWCKPFLSKDEKTLEETIDYIRCMTITQNVNPEIFKTLPNNILDQINKYINAPMTATWFNNTVGAPPSKEIITSELIYYWMIAHNIPMDYQKWHLNRLFTLIRVCNIKNQPPKKRGQKTSLADRAALNQTRKAKLETKG